MTNKRKPFYASHLPEAPHGRTIPESVTEIGSKEIYTAYNPNLILTVPRNSYAAEYAQANNIPYTYPDANDWLYN